jgi:hypothetical protein
MKSPLEIPNVFKIGPKFRMVYMKTWVPFVVPGDLSYISLHVHYTSSTILI